jgi:F-type H+-transporting ATPase subunit delta
MPLSEAHSDALADVYAKSIYQLAEAKGGQATVEDIAGELETILELTRTDPRFGEFLASRVLPVADRARSIDAIFKGRVSDLTFRFLQILNEKGRLYHLPAIGAAYDALVQQKFGKVEVDVYTADPLVADELRDIRAQLQRAIGREPIVHNYVEPAMIGGVKIQIGDRLIDGSIATQLRRVKDQILTHGAAELRASAERMIDGAGGPL